MIAVDSSALVAIFRAEPEAGDMVARLAPSERRVISAANWLEAAMVCQGGNDDPAIGDVFDKIVETLKLEVLPVTPEQARIARQAFLTYGRGSGHPARLNFGDCFAYALARSLDAPLLFKGEDFARTDVRVA